MDKFTTEFRLKDHIYIAQYIASKLGINDLSDITSFNEVEEGPAPDGYSHMFHELLSRRGRRISEPRLRKYDNNIKEYTDKLNRYRDIPIKLKYFQYLAVLFTEIYLDEYFQNPKRIVNELANYVIEKDIKPIPRISREYTNKIAYWMATGSGKTLIMHINLWQFQRYNKGKHKLDYDNIILVTANDDMTDQHLEDLARSGIEADFFDGTKLAYYSGGKDTVKAISIHKLTEEKTGGGVTIDIDTFGIRNLVLVDEGHKGKKSKESQTWKRIRDKLAKKGFTFEYSATFSQIISSKHDENFQEYSESIIFDYSYKFFHHDRYGKDFRILNLDTRKFEEDHIPTLLLANAMSFYEQLTVYKETSEVDEYNIEKPLWIFVGAKVWGVTSDIVKIIEFLNHLFKSSREEITEEIRKIYDGNSGILTPEGKDLFDKEYPERNFPYLRREKRTADEIYEGIFREIFHVDPNSTGRKLHIVDLKNSDGEIGLKASSLSKFFGVINISDSLKRTLVKQVEKNYEEIAIDENVTRDSLFEEINKNNTLNILVGAKKFIEGWNSWRVSNMCLINVGKSEGPQIIQLFGRGVRLKGKNWSLKRTTPIDAPPQYLNLLETLNVYGIKAKYMERFKDIVEKEEIPTYTAIIETEKIDPFPSDLKVIAVKEDWDFYQEVFPLNIDESITVKLDLRPIATEIDSRTESISVEKVEVYEKNIDPVYIELLNWDEICLDIVKYKKLKEYYNLSIKKQDLREFIENEDNYTLLCDDRALTVNNFEDLDKVKEIALLLLEKYIDIYYRRRRNASEKENIQLKSITQEDPNIEEKYQLKLKSGKEKLKDYIRKLIKSEEIYKSSKEITLVGDLRTYIYKQPPKFRNAYYEKHLYQPLLINRNEEISLIPAGLNEGEAKFVDDLAEYLKSNPYPDKEIYLLRNSTKGKGIGFFKEHSFYPDFIMWIVEGENQKVLFIDPKGLTHIDVDEEKKLKLHEHLRNIIQPKLGTTQVELDSYIVSVTEWTRVKEISGKALPIDKFAKDNHLLFQYKDYVGNRKILNEGYIENMFDLTLSGNNNL
jgi:hypothetical protein